MAEAKKKAVYKEDAVDGDKDGLVQDGTEFERPAPKAAKKVEKAEVVQPDWFVELEAAPAVPEVGEPEAVARMRDA